MHGDRDFPSDPRQYARPYDAPQETDLPPSGGGKLKGASIFVLCTISGTIGGSVFGYMAWVMLGILSFGAGWLWLDPHSVATFGAIIGAIIGAVFGLAIEKGS